MKDLVKKNTPAPMDGGCHAGREGVEQLGQAGGQTALPALPFTAYLSLSQTDDQRQSTDNVVPASLVNVVSCSLCAVGMHLAVGEGQVQVLLGPELPWGACS